VTAGRLWLVGAVLALIALPWLMPNDFYVNLASQILVYAIWALSLNLLVGFAGMQSLGHAVYLGGGAYVCAWLMANAGIGHVAAAILTLGIVTVMAGLFGLLALRATGLGFLMITLALGQILWGVAYRWVDFTGGDNGIRLPSRPAPFGFALTQAAPFYYFALIAFAIALLFMWRIAQSPFGAGLRGTRDQPRRMSALGYNVWLIRWSAFVLAGFWGGVAGLLYVYYNKFVSPQALSLQQSAEVLIMTILGGVGSIAGPVVGAVIITVVKTVVSSYVDRWNTLLGVIFLAVIVFMPEGVVPGLHRLWRKVRA
jgi:branched-chain amino acid transport system permease protein